MKKWVCSICGYVYEGESAPEQCPICKAPADKFVEQSGELVFADEHRVGVAKGADPRIIEGLQQNFTGECTEVGMYLAMSRVAEREGYPEIADAYKRYAFEEAEHAAKFAELRVAAEHGACAGKKELATLAKELGLDAVHDTVHEMAKDEARHGCGFNGLLKRYFGK